MNTFLILATSFVAIFGLLSEPKKDTDAPMSAGTLSLAGYVFILLFLSIGTAQFFLEQENQKKEATLKNENKQNVATIKDLQKNSESNKEILTNLEDENGDLKNELQKLNSRHESLSMSNLNLMAKQELLINDNNELKSNLNELSKLASKLTKDTVAIRNSVVKHFLEVQFDSLTMKESCYNRTYAKYYYELAVNGETVISHGVEDAIMANQNEPILFKHKSIKKTVSSAKEVFTISGLIYERKDDSVNLWGNWWVTSSKVFLSDIATIKPNTKTVLIENGSCKAELTYSYQITSV